MKKLLISYFVFTSGILFAHEPEEKSNPIPWAQGNKVKEPKFIEVKPVNNNYRGDSIYADIMNHSHRPYLKHSMNTQAHETTHFVNGDITNTQPQPAGTPHVTGLYVRKNRGILFKQPNITKSDVIPFVPNSLRHSRFKFYIVGNPDKNNIPLCILDEAIAYWNGCAVSVEEVQKGRYKDGNEDGISGCMDYSVLSVALVMAIEQKDPKYFEKYPDFKNFVGWYLKGAEETFTAGSEMSQFNWYEEQKVIYRSLRSSSDAAKMRDYINKNFDGVWLK